MVLSVSISPMSGAERLRSGLTPLPCIGQRASLTRVANLCGDVLVAFVLFEISDSGGWVLPSLVHVIDGDILL